MTFSQKQKLPYCLNRSIGAVFVVRCEILGVVRSRRNEHGLAVDWFVSENNTVRTFCGWFIIVYSSAVHKKSMKIPC